VPEVFAERLPQPVGLLHLDLAASFDHGRGHVLLLGIGLDLRREPLELAGPELHVVLGLFVRRLEADERRRVATTVRMGRHRLGEIGLLHVLERDWRPQAED
jgi:hypothetical protein